jgi:glucose/arabinose dehydrogenase
VRRCLASLAVLLCAALPSAARAAAPGEVVATGIPFATNVTFDGRGGMWVTSGAPFRQSGDGVWYVAHAGAKPVHVISGTSQALGLTWFRGKLYVTSQLGQVTGIVARYSQFNGRRFAHRRVILPAVPIGRHALATIVPGPNSRLYVGAGAEHDTIAGGHPTSGTVISFKGDGSDIRIEAAGLRGPFGLAFLPGTASLLVTDDGRDDLGARRPPDELNLVRNVTLAAPDFGFPGCADFGGPVCARTAAPLVRLPAHAGVGGVAVTRDWAGQGLTAFVAENGPIVPGAAAVPTVRMIALHRRPGGGYDAKATPLATGFGDQDPLGVAIGPGGALYVTLFTTGEVVRFFPGYRA